MTEEVFGLGDDAEQVYRAVFEAVSATPAVLSAATGLSGERVDQALEVLVTSGLVLRVPGSPVRYEPAAASTAWGVWLQGLADRLRPVQDLAQAFATLPQSSSGSVAGVVELVEGRGAIARRADELQRGTRSQLRIIDKPPYAAVTGSDSLERERELLARGVKVRAVYDTAGLASLHDLREDIQPAAAAGEQARVRTDAPLKLVLFDQSAALVPVASDQTELSQALVIHRSALLDALDALFEHVWDSALPFDLSETLDDAVHAGQEGPSLEELQLLALLTAGLSDEAIARHLHVALRTVQRRVRAVMDHLGAATRFQAGLLAARSGWAGSRGDIIQRGVNTPDAAGERDRAGEPGPAADIEAYQDQIRELTARLADAEAARTAAETVLADARGQLDRARDRATETET